MDRKTGKHISPLQNPVGMMVDLWERGRWVHCDYCQEKCSYLITFKDINNSIFNSKKSIVHNVKWQQIRKISPLVIQPLIRIKILTVYVILMNIFVKLTNKRLSGYSYYHWQSGERKECAQKLESPAQVMHKMTWKLLCVHWQSPSFPAAARLKSLKIKPRISSCN